MERYYINISVPGVRACSKCYPGGLEWWVWVGLYNGERSTWNKAREESLVQHHVFTGTQIASVYAHFVSREKNVLSKALEKV